MNYFIDILEERNKYKDSLKPKEQNYDFDIS